MEVTDELTPKYKNYEKQRCFIAHSYDSPSQEALLATCVEILPKFDLEPWYACYFSDKYQKLEDIQYDTKKSPLEKVVDMIANARYGIYDLTMWKDESTLHQARNVLIELGIAIGLNRPVLLLHYNGRQSLPLPNCFSGVSTVEFSGSVTLKQELNKRIPGWIEIPPEQDWWNRYCHFGRLKCKFRESHPRGSHWGEKNLFLRAYDGNDKDQQDFREVVDESISRYADVQYEFFDNSSTIQGYNFLLCTTCQVSRTGAIGLYRLTPNTPPETFIAIGITIAQEKCFGYEIPMIFLARGMNDVPSLLTKFDIQLSENDVSLNTRLKVSIPKAIDQVRSTIWKPTNLPFIELNYEDGYVIDTGKEKRPSVDKNDDNDSAEHNKNQTMESLLESESLSVELPQVGEIRRGTIASISTSQILISVGAMADGVISGRELGQLTPEERTELKVGQEVSVYVVNPEDQNGNVVLSLKRAQEQMSWENVEKMIADETVIDTKIIGFNKGGLIVAVDNLRGYLPSSQLSARRRAQFPGASPEQRWQKMVGQPISVNIIEVDRERRRIILSERAANTESRASMKDRVIGELEEGKSYTGRVTSLADFGAFVNINGVDGLVHLSEISWGHLIHPKEILEVGQEVQVKVININRDKKRIGLSIRALQDDPWKSRVEKFNVGQLVEGVITRLTKFGAFARLEGDIEGLIHISELSQNRVEHPKEVLKEGDVKTLRVIRIDSDQHRIGLSLRKVDSTAFVD